MKRTTCQWSRNPERVRPSWNGRCGEDPLPNNPARGAQSECSSPRVSLAAKKEDAKKQKQKLGTKVRQRFIQKG